jgi:hypothetical protein
VDGLAVPLRGFRKSHHFVPAGPDPNARWTIGELQSAATRKRMSGRRVRIAFVSEFCKGKV